MMTKIDLLFGLCVGLTSLTIYSAAEIDQQIVGGINSNIFNHPHQLSLRVAGTHSCGASLISNNRAVTVAHCVGGAISGYSILGGTTDRTVSSCASCVVRDLVDLVRHPDFSNDAFTGYPNDIAVLSFASVTFGSNVKAVDLSQSTDGDYTGTSCTITGWGRTCPTCVLPSTLQVASTTVLDNINCGSIWGSSRINDGHVCVQSTTSALCAGDDGGPLVCGGKLVGAGSWGEAACSPAYPSVYSRISQFYDWITSQ